MTPEDIRAAITRSDRLLAENRCDDAIALLEPVAAAGLDDAGLEFQVQRQLGWGYGFRDDTTSAVRAFTAALSAARRFTAEQAEKFSFLVFDTRLQWIHEAMQLPDMPVERLLGMAHEVVAEAGGDPERTHRARVQRLNVLRALRRLDEAWEEAQILMQDARDAPSERRFSALVKAADVAEDRGDLNLSVELLRETARLPDLSARSQARLHQELGYSLQKLGLGEEAYVHARELLDLGGRLGLNVEIAANGLMVDCARAVGRLDEAARAADRMMEIARARGLDDIVMLHACFDQMDVAVDQGRHDDAREMVELATRIAERLDRARGTTEQQDELAKRLGRIRAG